MGCSVRHKHRLICSVDSVAEDPLRRLAGLLVCVSDVRIYMQRNLYVAQITPTFALVMCYFYIVGYEEFESL